MQLENAALFQQITYQLQQGRKVVLFVRGSSMYPFLRDNKDRVLLERPKQGDLKPGAIVLFLYNGHYYLHRMVKKSGNTYAMRGDNCIKVPQREVVGREAIQGIVRRVIRPDGTCIDHTSGKFKLCALCWRLSPRASHQVYRVVERFRSMISRA